MHPRQFRLVRNGQVVVVKQSHTTASLSHLATTRNVYLLESLVKHRSIYLQSLRQYQLLFLLLIALQLHNIAIAKAVYSSAHRTLLTILQLREAS